ncbi:hypothetical protein AZE42_06587 [Rhizopogon vesiculosus]|uniref:Uncharacterized protein n=1 Tax=Rhizopogon vesiculosus TaxID=180088 RepID=A0A1J8QCU9_9AGAM|nr:hypothetical protein AZE42_06587 [Rhizopogon vesiculosus]
MGGKRNAARARTRDSTSRLQRRHFGQQRLAAALCNTREEREKPQKMTLELALHEISLAPAQRDPKITRSIPSTAHTNTSYNPSSTPTASLDISKRRKPPSKILRALDFSDSISYRDTIDRILSIPLSEIIGLPLRGKSPHAQDVGSNASYKEPLSIDYDNDSNVQVQETSSYVRSSQNDSSSTSASHLFSMNTDGGHHYEGLYNDHLSKAVSQTPSPDTRHHLSWSVEVDDLRGDFVNDSGYADTDAPVTGTPRGPILTPDLLGPQRCISPPSNSFPFSFFSGSQGIDECILNMDTSPPSSSGSFVCSMPLDASPVAMSHCENSPNHDPSLQQSPSRSASLLSSPAPINSLDFFGWDNFKSSSPQCHPSASGSSGELRSTSQWFYPTEVSASCGGPFQFSYPAIPAIRTELIDADSISSVNSSHEFSSFGDSDIQDPGIPLDILNDPDPWATIGKILNLETVEECDNDDIYFTCGREGVGHVRPTQLDETAQKWSSEIHPPQSVAGEDEHEPRATMNDEHIEDSQLKRRPSPDDYTDSSLVDDTNSIEQNKPVQVCVSTRVEFQMQAEPGPPQIAAALAYQASRHGSSEDEMCEGPCLFVDSDGDDE